ncbi:hypothetical protein pb186bvf_008805 [Paramecium bursaria]
MDICKEHKQPGKLKVASIEIMLIFNILCDECFKII